MSSKVQVEVEDGILLIGLNRPEKLNALDEEMWITIRETLDRYRSQYIAIIYGKGRAFSAGDDIYMMYNAKDKSDTDHIVFNLIKPLIKSISNYEMPLIAAVDGYAFGAGCEMLLLMDLVIASPRSTFAVPEARIGLIPPLMLSLARDIPGIRRAIYLTLTGKWLNVEEAREYGLVDVIDDDPLNKAKELAKKILKIPRETLIRIKRNVNRYKANLIDDSILEDLSYLMSIDESKRLMDLFLNKKL